MNNDEIRILRLNQARVDTQVRILKARVNVLVQAQLENQAIVDAQIHSLQESTMTLRHNQYRVDLLEVKVENLSDAVIDLTAQVNIGFRDQSEGFQELKGEFRELKEMLMKLVSDK